MFRNAMLVVVSTIVGLGFISLAQAKKSRTIANGSWGGTHIQLSIENGSARIEYDCANGTIAGPLKIDRRGQVSLAR